MSATLNETAVHALKALRVENEWLSVRILPDPKPSGRGFLWHNPRIKPQAFPIEANFDNYWCACWDGGFPTCDACKHQGENYPNLGELRSLAWQVDEAGTRNGEAVVRLSAFGPISPVRAEKTVTLRPRRAAPVLDTPSGPTDLSRVRGMDAKLFCGHCATDLRAGWYAIEHQRTGEGFLLQFPKDDLPYLWMWLVYVGWRGYHHVIVEPWSSYPVQLSEAVRQKTRRLLEPGGAFSVRIRATICGAGETLEQALRRMEES